MAFYQCKATYSFLFPHDQTIRITLVIKHPQLLKFHPTNRAKT